MIGKSKVVAIIPARGGSKGLPGKNIINLAGKPLIAYTIETALKSNYIDRVIVSTDDKKIARISEEFGAEIPFLRPRYLAGDTVHTPPVVGHAVKFLEKKGYNADLIVTLQPTSPLRRIATLNKAIKMIYRSGFGSVVSVRPSGYPPYWAIKIKRKKVIPFVSDGVDYFKKERQQLAKTYEIDGSIYVTRRKAMRQKSAIIVTGNCGAIVSGHEESLDVDTREDIEKIKKTIKKYKTKKEHKK